MHLKRQCMGVACKTHGSFTLHARHPGKSGSYLCTCTQLNTNRQNHPHQFVNGSVRDALL